MIGERILGADPAEAATPDLTPARFFSGTLNGDAISYWTFWVAIAGKRARGFAFNSDTIDSDEPQGYRLNGSYVNNKLNLTFYDLDDVNEVTPVGTLTGLYRHVAIRGTYSLASDSEAGEFVLSPVPVDKPGTAQLAGTYRGRVEDGEGGVLYNGQLKLRANGTYEITNITQPGTGTEGNGAPPPTRLAGKFSLVVDGQVWICPTAVPVAPDAPCASDPLACVPVLQTRSTVHGARVEVEHPFRGCVAIARHR